MTGKYPQALEELMELLRGLPGVGRRSAERMAFCLYSWDNEKLEALSANFERPRPDTDSRRETSPSSTSLSQE